MRFHPRRSKNEPIIEKGGINRRKRPIILLFEKKGWIVQLLKGDRRGIGWTFNPNLWSGFLGLLSVQLTIERKCHFMRLCDTIKICRAFNNGYGINKVQLYIYILYRLFAAHLSEIYCRIRSTSLVEYALRRIFCSLTWLLLDDWICARKGRSSTRETILQFFRNQWFRMGMMKFWNFEKIQKSNLIDYEYIKVKIFSSYKKEYRRESTLLIPCYR